MQDDEAEEHQRRSEAALGPTSMGSQHASPTTGSESLDNQLATLTHNAASRFDTEQGRRAFERLAIILTRPATRIAKAKLEALLPREAVDDRDINEIVLTALFQLYRSIPRYRSGAPVIPWFAGIVHRQAIDFIRRQRHTRAKHGVDTVPYDQSAFSVPGRPDDSDQQLDIQKVARKLSPNTQQVLDLVGSGHTPAEIAVEMRKPVQWVRKQIEELRAQLALALSTRSQPESHPRHLEQGAVAPSAQPEEGSSGIRQAFASRFGQVVQHLAEAADERTLTTALSVADPISALAVVLERSVSLQPPHDPLAAARARGAAGRERLVRQAGGLLRLGGVAKTLNISPQAVQGRRSRGTILAVMASNGEWRYPACQFTDEGLLPELGTVLSAFRDVDPWQQLAVLLAPSARFGGRNIIELLGAGEVDAAKAIAATYGEQG